MDERKFYQIELKDKHNHRWYRDEGEYDTEAELHEEMGEVIQEAGKGWRVVEVIVKETIVSRGYEVKEKINELPQPHGV